MFTFRFTYFILALVLFFIEVFIALFIRDRFVRPYMGDFLVVILLYCALRAVIRTSVTKAAIGVLLFAYLVELLQWMKLVPILGLQDNPLATTVLGTSFEWMDMVAYTLGMVTVLCLERINAAWPAQNFAANRPR